VIGELRPINGIVVGIGLTEEATPMPFVLMYGGRICFYGVLQFPAGWRASLEPEQ